MNYEDRTVVSLADPATRPDAFDQIALEQIAAAGYDVDAMGVSGPYTAVFDDFRLAISAEAEGTLEGALGPAPGAAQTQASFRFTGLPEAAPLRVDALWRGAIVARFREGGEPITAVATGWPSLGAIDAEVAAENGGNLPADSDTLEAARRSVLIAQVHAGVHDPATFDDAALDAWLAQAGASSVGDLIEHLGGSAELGSASITYAAPAAVPESPKRLPLLAAVLVRDEAFSLADLLAETSLVRERMTRLGAVQPSANGLRPLRPLVVIWILPQSVFEDADWPGADADVRRSNAGAWLAQAGIGLAATA